MEQQGKLDLKTLYFPQMEKWIRQNDIAKYKARIIWDWIYKKQAVSFDQMTNLSKADREMLSGIAYISSAKVISKKKSARDRSVKFLFELEDGAQIESVYIESRDHSTLCVSSQVGCAQSCSFCATGDLGFKRNLYSHEILEQLLAVMREGYEFQYVVFMGMGEPLLNLDNLVASINLIKDPNTFGLGARKITVSTCGIIPAMKKLADMSLGVNLAISLNAAGNNARSQLMPINKKYAIGQLMDAARYFQEDSGRRITFEYILLKDINDSDKDAQDLVKLMQGLVSHVNLIVYNIHDTSSGLQPSQRAEEFKAVLIRNKVSVTIRNSAGSDIAGACGQLAAR